MVDEFKELFFSEITPASIFGLYSLKNSKLIKAKITKVNFEFEEKVMELESYIFKL
jgi:hypothetical protein